ncbi:unnamed protein product [Aphanomyces euteiches]
MRVLAAALLVCAFLAADARSLRSSEERLLKHKSRKSNKDDGDFALSNGETYDPETNEYSFYPDGEEQTKFVDEDGNLVDEDGNLIDEDGNLIDEDGNLIDVDEEQTKFVDEDGNLVDEDGNLIDEDGNLIDEDGNIIDLDGEEESVDEDGEIQGSEWAEVDDDY